MKNAFTLIELLIVVAIIAILAAIAVPNFLEAQTRAKVVRSVANERAIATAAEAYRIDNKGALPQDYPGPVFYFVNRYLYYRKLSTPVAYMTTVPEDPFLRSLVMMWPDWGSTYWCNYDMEDENIARAVISHSSSPGMSSVIDASTEDIRLINDLSLAACRNSGKPNANWLLRGYGPMYMGIGQRAAGGPYGGQTYVIPYDPSNGTMSMGNVFYFN